MAAQQEGLYILLIRVHGLIRGHDLELERDETQCYLEMPYALQFRPLVEKLRCQ